MFFDYKIEEVPKIDKVREKVKNFLDGSTYIYEEQELDTLVNEIHKDMTRFKSGDLNEEEENALSNFGSYSHYMGDMDVIQVYIYSLGLLDG